MGFCDGMPARMRARKEVFMASYSDSQPNMARGLMGAALGAAFNILIWIVIGSFNIPGSISGWICSLIAIYLYEYFGGKVEKKAVLWIALICVVFLLLANFIFWSWQITVGLNAQAGERAYSILEGMKRFPSFLKQDPEFAISLVIRDVIVSLGLCAVGMVANLIPKFRRQAEAEQEAQAAQYDRKYIEKKNKKK